MEDYPRQSADEEKSTSTKKRRRSFASFFETWMERRNLPLELQPEDEQDDEDEETNGLDPKESKKSKLISKIGSFLPKLFKHSVQVNKIKHPEQNQEPLLGYGQEAASSEETIGDTEDGFRLQYEYDEELSDSREDNSTPEQPEPNLPTSQEVLEIYNKQAEFVLPPVVDETYEPVQLWQQEQNRIVNQIDESGNTAETASTENANYKTGAISAGEVLHHRRQEQMERQIRKLKKHAKTLKNEQKEFKHKQEQFTKNLSEQAAIIEKSYLKLVPEIKPETKANFSNKQTEDKNLKLAYAGKLNQNQPEMLKPANQKPTKEILNEVGDEQLKELIKIPLPTKAETILHRVEEAADHNIPIENLYERRHEVKGEPDNYTVPIESAVAHSAQAPTLSQMQPIFVRNVDQQIPATGQSARPDLHVQPPASSLIGGQDLYKQAARGGFMAGVTIVTLLIIWLLIR